MDGPTVVHGYLQDLYFAKPFYAQVSFTLHKTNLT